MLEWLHGIHYHNPDAAYFMFGLVALIVSYVWLIRQREESLRIFLGQPLLQELSERRSLPLTLLRASLCSLSWMLATLALMDPYISTHESTTLSPQPVLKNIDRQRKAHNVLLLIDASASMAVRDGRSGTSRFEQAKQIGDELLENLHGESVGLYAFTSKLIPIVPPTWDYLFVRLLLSELQINEADTSGTDMLQALKSLREKFWQEQHPDRTVTVVILSDGGDTEYEALNGHSKQKRLHELLQTVSNHPELQVISVGMGSTEGEVIPNVTQNGQPVRSKLNVELLQALSAERGQYLTANEQSTFESALKLQELIAQHTQYVQQDASLVMRPTVQIFTSHSLFQIPLLFAILALVVAIYLPERTTTRVVS